MNEFRAVKQEVLAALEKCPIGPAEHSVMWFKKANNPLNKSGWCLVEGSEKLVLINNRFSYVVKFGYKAHLQAVDKEFANYRWFKQWFPAHTLPTAKVQDLFLVQPKAQYLNNETPEFLEFYRSIIDRYRPLVGTSNYKRNSFIDFCAEVIGYNDAHLGNFGLWRNRICWIDFNGLYSRVEDFKPPRN